MRDLTTHRRELSEEKGRGPVLAAISAAVYGCAAAGISDFPLNTFVFRKLQLVDDKRLPATLTSSYVLSGTVIALIYISGGGAEGKTLLLCVAFEAAGAVLGVHIVSRLNAASIRLVMGLAMLGSIVIILARMFAANGHAGLQEGLSGSQYLIALPILFLLGVLNMMGFGMKAPSITLLLMLGMSAMHTLTVVMAMACCGSITGGIQYVRGGNYQRKIVAAASAAGPVGAVMGSLLVSRLNPSVLQWILIGVLGYTSYTLLLPKRISN